MFERVPPWGISGSVVEFLPLTQETQVQFPVNASYDGPVCLGFPCDPAGKEATCNAGDLGSIHGLGRSHGEGKGYPLQYPLLATYKDDALVLWRARCIQLSHSCYLKRNSIF